MPPPFTRRQAQENSRFLEVLRRTGNARLAAREIGRAHSTMHQRRRGNAAFAQGWEAAAAAASAAFHLAGGKRGPSFDPEQDQKQGKRKNPSAGSGRPLDFARDERSFVGGGGARVLRQAQDDRGEDPLRTAGGEPMVVRTRSGRLQIRPAHKGKLTKAAEQVFLRALSATANIRLSAAAAGASPAAFYRRRRQCPAFAREFRIALRMGYERLELAAMASAMPESWADDSWRQAEPPPMPPMTPAQALQLLGHHRKKVELGWDKPHLRKRRREPWETYTERLRAMWAHEQNLTAEDDALRRAARYESSGGWRYEDEAPPPELPPLELVTGWSRARPGKAPHNPELALFGGGRIAEMERKKRGRG